MEAQKREFNRKKEESGDPWRAKLRHGQTIYVNQESSEQSTHGAGREKGRARNGFQSQINRRKLQEGHLCGMRRMNHWMIMQRG